MSKTNGKTRDRGLIIQDPTTGVEYDIDEISRNMQPGETKELGGMIIRKKDDFERAAEEDNPRR